MAEHHQDQNRLGPANVHARVLEQEMLNLNKQMRPFLLVFLRVPSLFVLDAICSQTVDFGDYIRTFPWLETIILFCVCFAAIVVFILPSKTVVTIYIFLLIFATLKISYWWSEVFLDKMDATDINQWDLILPNLHQSDSYIPAIAIVFSFDFMLYILMQVVYATLFSTFMSRGNAAMSNGVKYFLIFMLPVLTQLGLQAVFMSSKDPWFLSTDNIMTVTKYLHVLPALLEVVPVLLNNIITFRYKAVAYYRTFKYIITNFGIQAFVEDQWIRLNVPNILRVFWMIRFSFQVADTILKSTSGNTVSPTPSIWNITTDLSTSSCDSSLAVLGLSAVVAMVTHHIGALTDKFLGGNSDEVANIGPVSAVLFFILAIQTGLAGLVPSKRFVRLYRNCILLTTALLHFFHSMVNQVMMTLSTSHSTSISRHVRALIMCAILVLFPVALVLYLWLTAPLGTWLFAVTAFCMELVVKVAITLIIYILFLIDTHSGVFWEDLDDYVYYIKAVGSTVEFIVGIFLLGNGLWILFMESGGIIRGIMIFIHAYFNIFQLGKDGWKKFKNRRMAVKKINSLPEADPSQLGDHNDVCLICYQELQMARITPCGHLFHALCLRKWLYVQDSCPLCHKEIMQKPEETETKKKDDRAQEQEVLLI